MGHALPTWMRQRIIEEHLNGKTLTQIAQEQTLSYSTVRRCWHRYQERGIDGLRRITPTVLSRDPANKTLSIEQRDGSSSCTGPGEPR